jgi:hypothetical protein
MTDIKNKMAPVVAVFIEIIYCWIFFGGDEKHQTKQIKLSAVKGVKNKGIVIV